MKRKETQKNWRLFFIFELLVLFDYFDWTGVECS